MRTFIFYPEFLVFYFLLSSSLPKKPLRDLSHDPLASAHITKPSHFRCAPARYTLTTRVTEQELLQHLFV